MGNRVTGYIPTEAERRERIVENWRVLRLVHRDRIEEVTE